MRWFVLLALIPSLSLATDYLDAASLAYPNSPKVAKPGKACPAPLNENFCAADVAQRDGFDAEVHARLKAIQGLTLWTSAADGWLTSEVVPTLAHLGNPAANKAFNMGDNHLSFRWVQPVTGGGIDGAMELEASGAFSGDLLHIHQYNGNPGVGTHLLHVEGSDPDVVPVHIVSGNALALHTEQGIQAGSFVGASGNIETRIALLEAAVASFGGGVSPVQAPTCTAISPTSGPVGTVVTITGSAFATATAVTFPTARSASFAKQSDAQITTTVPASSVDGAIVITTASPTPATCPAFDVTTGTPGAPTSLAASSITTSSVELSWTAPVTGTPTGYHVHQAPDVAGVPGTYARVATPTLTSAAVGGLSPGTSYWFYVHATSAEGDGPNTAPLKVTTLADETPPEVASGTPLFGTTYSLANLPLSYWEPSIKAEFGVASILDSAATTDLQNCMSNTGDVGCPNWNANGQEVVFKLDSYSTYYVEPGDAEYLPYSATYDALYAVCPLDVGTSWAYSDAGAVRSHIRIPAHAKAWSAGATYSVVGSAPVLAEEVHMQIVDEERNRIYTFYSYGGHEFGVSGDGYFHANSIGCDLLRGSDANIQAPLDPAIRFNCNGGAGYNQPRVVSATEGPGCGINGIGAGINTGPGGTTFANGDSNGIHGPYGVIMPQDFEDAGWTGEAVGTFHHALRTSIPGQAMGGYQWPEQDPGNYDTPASRIRNGQLMRLDPAYDCVANTGGASPTDLQKATRRFCRTLQVYGAYIDDGTSASAVGPEFFALSDWAGTGPARNTNYSPWSANGMVGTGMSAAAIAEAVAFATGQSANGVVESASRPLPANAWPQLQMVLPHGASYPARTVP